MSTTARAALSRRNRLLSSCAVAAIALAVQATSARAQQITGFQGTPTVIGNATVSADNSLITVRDPRAIINWSSDTANFLPSGNSATFTGASPYIVLNRILPSYSGATQINGTINSNIGGQLPGGSVWFYSPNGLLVGANARINVGSLLLSANNLSDNQFLNGENSTFTFSRGDSNAGVTVEQGAQISALGNGAYVALIAPRVRQSGDVTVNGSAAYIAAENVTMTINGSLFDIRVDQGTSAGDGEASDEVLVHDGNTDRVDNSGSADQSRDIIAVAVPKNEAITLLVSGNLTYTPASEAAISGNRIILSAGYSVNSNNFAPIGGQAAPRAADIKIGNGNYNGDVIGQATRDATATATASDSDGADLFFNRSLNLTAGRVAGVYALAGGTATINSLTLRANALGANTNDIGGSITANPNRAEIIADGGSITVNGSPGLFANATGGNGPLGGGDAVGGTARIWAINSGTFATGGSPSLEANGTGGNGSLGGKGTGGSVELRAAAGGTLSINGSPSLDAAGRGGTGSAGAGGDGVGGSGNVTITGGGFVSVRGSADIDVTGFGGSGESGGDGVGGTIRLDALGSSLSHLGSMTLTADGRGGDLNVESTGDYGGGIGGVVEVKAAPQGEGIGRIAVNGSFRINASGFGAGSNGQGGDGGSGGVGVGGDASVILRGGEHRFGSLRITAAATGGDAGDSGGDSPTFGGGAVGGAIDLQVFGGASIDAGRDGQAVNPTTVSLRADAQGGGGESGGDGGGAVGGAVNVAIDDGTSSLTDLNANASSIGGDGRISEGDSEGGRGGDAVGGDMTLTVAVEDNRIDQLIARTDASGGRGGGTRISGSDGGRGGDAVGGALTVNIAGGDEPDPIDSVILRADASGGRGGGFEEIGTDGGRGGDAVGGDIEINVTGGNALQSLTARADADGGDGDDGSSFIGTAGGRGGDAVGGALTLTFDEGANNLASFFLNVGAEGGSGGGGGFSENPESATLGGDGGDGLGGAVEVSVGGSSQLTVTDTISLDADGYGGYGFNGGDGTGGLAEITAQDGTITAFSIFAAAEGYGGDAGVDENNPETSGTGGDGFGGTARLAAGTGGALLIAGHAEADATGYGGYGHDGGNGTGGLADIAIAGGTLNAASLGAIAEGYGGGAGNGQSGGEGIYGDGTGGAVTVNVSSSLNPELVNGFLANGGNARLAAGGFGGGSGSCGNCEFSFAAAAEGTGGAGAGGTVDLLIETGMSAGSLSVDVSGTGGDGNFDFEGPGGDGSAGTGGTARLVFAGGTSNIGNAFVDAGGRGGDGGQGGFGVEGDDKDGGNGGVGTGGAIFLTQSGGRLETGTLSLIAQGEGGEGGDVGFGPGVAGDGGDAEGGLVEARLIGGTASIAFFEIDVGAFGGSNFNFSEGGFGGFGGNGGDALGGTALLAVENATAVSFLGVRAAAFGGEGGQGQFNNDGAGGAGGRGGSGTGGGLSVSIGEAGVLNANSASLFATGEGGRGGDGGSSDFESAASGGSGGDGGVGTGGSIALDVIGGQMLFGGEGGLDLDSDARGGDGGEGGFSNAPSSSGGIGGRGGNATGGSGAILVNGGSAILDRTRISITADGGRGGDGGRTEGAFDPETGEQLTPDTQARGGDGGDAEGGTGTIELVDGSLGIQDDGYGFFNALEINAGAEGGDGESAGARGGNATGGQIRLSSTGESSLDLNFAYFSAQGEGGEGGDGASGTPGGSTAGPGGDATGGSIDVAILGGTLSVIDLQLDVEAFGGSNFNFNEGGFGGDGGAGGNAQGGDASINVENATADIDFLNVYAAGFGGEGGQGVFNVAGIGGAGGRGGDGAGGNVQVRAGSGGAIGFGSVDLDSEGEGGDGGDGNDGGRGGDGGFGTGGTVAVAVVGGEMLFGGEGGLDVDADGHGGRGGNGGSASFFNEYRFVGGEFSWDEALAAAGQRQLGGVTGHLVTITSTGENDQVANRILNADSSSAWAAASDQGDEGNFTWRAGPETAQAVSFTNWSQGQPNNGGPGTPEVPAVPENFLEVGADGSWNDLNTSSRRGFVVEFETSHGSGEAGRGGNATGGVVSVDATGGTLQVQGFSSVELDVDGEGGEGGFSDFFNSIGGNATGGSATLSAGTDGGILIGGNVELGASAQGGHGSGNAGDGQGGTALIRAAGSGASIVIGGFTEVDAFGGEFFVGDSCCGDSGIGGTNTGGTASIEAVDGASIEFDDDVELRAFGRGGLGSQAGGDGFGGIASILSAGSDINIDGDLYVDARSFGGVSFDSEGGYGDGAGGGLASLEILRGGRIGAPSFTLDVSGIGGQLEGDNGGCSECEFTLAAASIGNGSGGDGVGGTAVAIIDGTIEGHDDGESTIERTSLFLDARGTGGDASTFSFVSDGSSGQGGSASVDFRGGENVLESLALDVRGFGGRGGDAFNFSQNGFAATAVGTGGAGGAGTGGSATLSANGGTASVDELFITADGFGGEGGSGLSNAFGGTGDGGAGGIGGAGTGGSLLVDAGVGGILTLPAAEFSASGFGGEGGRGGAPGSDSVGGTGGAGGIGAGGLSELRSSGGSLTVFSEESFDDSYGTISTFQYGPTVRAEGRGGRGGEGGPEFGYGATGGTGGVGGTGTGGIALMNAVGGELMSGPAEVFAGGAGGVGGFGGSSFNFQEGGFPSGNGGAGGIGGEGTGGTAELRTGDTAIPESPGLLTIRGFDTVTDESGTTTTLNGVLVDATGQGGGGGGGGDGRSGGTGGDGGLGQGGTAHADMAGGMLTTGPAVFFGTASGGEGGGGGNGSDEGDTGGRGGNGGDGLGGDSGIRIAGGRFQSSFASIQSGGQGGEGGSGGFGAPSEIAAANGIGGDGAGGIATIMVADGEDGGSGSASIQGFVEMYASGSGEGARSGAVQIITTTAAEAGSLQIFGPLFAEAFGDNDADHVGFLLTTANGPINVGSALIQVDQDASFAGTGSGSLVSAFNIDVAAGGSVLLAQENPAPGVSLLNAGADTLLTAGGAILGGTAGITAGRDVILRAAGDILLAFAQTGDDVDGLSEIGAISVDTANATGLGEENDDDGSNIFLTAQGDVTLNAGDAADDIDLTSSGGTIRSGTLLAAGSDVTADAFGDVILNSASSGFDIELLAGGGIISTGLLAAGSDVFGQAGGNIAVNDATSGFDIDFIAGGSAVAAGTLTADFNVEIEAEFDISVNRADAGFNVDLDAGGSVTAVGLGAGFNVTVLAGEDIAVEEATTGFNIRLTAGDAIEATTLNAGANLQANAGGDIDFGTASAGDSPSLTGNMDLVAGGSINAAVLDADLSVSAEAGGDIVVVNVTTGRDIFFEAVGSITSAGALVAGLDLDGRAGGDITFATAHAGDEFDLRADGSIAVATGEALGANASNDGGSILIDAGDAVRLDNGRALRRIMLTARGGQIDSAGLLTAVQLDATAATDIALTDVDVINNLVLATANGAVSGRTFASDGSIDVNARDGIALGGAMAGLSIELETAGSITAGSLIAGTDITGIAADDVTIGMMMAGTTASEGLGTFIVDALANSAAGGTAINSIEVTAGQPITFSASTDDLWSAGPLPRFSDANGLVATRFASATDDSGQAPGTQIGSNFGLLGQSGFAAPFGALVGEVGGTFVLLGTNGTVAAPATGTLRLSYWDSNAGDNSGTVAVRFGSMAAPATGQGFITIRAGGDADIGNAMAGGTIDIAATSLNLTSAGAGVDILLTASEVINLGGGAITAGTGSATLNGAVAINGAVEISAATQALFNGAVDGNDTSGDDTLSVSSGTGAMFAGSIGASAALQSLDVSGPATLNGSGVTTIGGQSYGGPVSLGADNVLTGAAGTLSGGVVGNGHDLALNFSGTTTIDGGFTGVRNLSSDAGGTTELSGAITTSGTQIYNDAVTLAGDTTLTGTSGTFVNGVAGNDRDLALNFAGTTALNGGFAGINDLSTGNGGSTILSGAIQTTGTQTYGDAVSLAANSSLTSSGDGAAGAIAFGGTVDGNQGLTIDAASVDFGGTVGGVTPLTMLIARADGDISAGAITAGSVMLTPAGRLTAGNVTATMGNLMLSAGAGALQTGALRSLLDLNVANSGGALSTGDVESLGGTVRLGASTDIALGNVRAAGSIFVTGAGVITAGNLTAGTGPVMGGGDGGGSGGSAAPAGIAPGFDDVAFFRNDDSATGAIPLPFMINYFGVERSQTFVSNNGYLTFNSGQGTFTPGGLGTGYSGQPIIAGFFADVDTRNQASAQMRYGDGTFAGRPAFGATWDGVGYFSGQADKLNNFQIVLTDRSDTGAGNFDIYYNYTRIRWETGSASGGQNGFGGVSAAVGYNAGTGNQPGTFFELPGSRVPGSFLDSGPMALVSSTNNGTPGQLLFQVRNGQVTPGTGSTGAGDIRVTNLAAGNSGNITLGNLTGAAIDVQGVNQVTTGAVDATRTASLSAAGALNYATLQSGETATLAGLGITGGATASGEDLIATAGADGITLSTVDATGDVNLQAQNGAILVSTDLAAGGNVDASGRAVTLNAEGPLSVRSATATGGDVRLTSAGNLGIEDAQASGDVSASSGGTLALAGDVDGIQLSLSSRDIAIGSEAQVGTTARTTGIEITANGGAVTIGGTGTGEGYRLDNAEFGRLAARDISIGNASDAGVLIEGLTVRGAAAANPNLTGRLTVSGNGNVTMAGRLNVENGTAANSVRIVAGNAFSANALTSGIAITNGTALAGSIDIEARSITVASPSAVTDLAAAATIEARSDRLGQNNGATDNGGYLRAGSIRLAASERIHAQNSGATSESRDDRAGLTAGAGGITLVSIGTTPLEVIINGREENGNGGFVTGQALIGQLTLSNATGGAGSFAAGSTVNGCLLSGAPCGVIVQPPPPPPPPPPPSDLDDSVRDLLDDAEGSLTRAPVIAFTQLINVEGGALLPVVDEPVTGTGNDDIYLGAEAFDPACQDDRTDCVVDQPVTGAGNEDLQRDADGTPTTTVEPPADGGVVDAPVTGTGNEDLQDDDGETED